MEAVLKNMPYKLEAAQDEKAATAGAFFGMAALPLCVWGLYSIMEPTGNLDDAGNFFYTVKHIAPTIFMQWFLFEAMAKVRIAKAKAGKCPMPWEPAGRLGTGQPTPEGIDALNPSFYALWDRVCQNNFESTVLNTFAIMCLSLFCGGYMYDARLPVALGYMHAIGGFVYAYFYAFCGPNHRMYGFIFRGFWNNGAVALFCFFRSFGLMEQAPKALFWICAVGLPFILIILIKTVKAKYTDKVPEGELFGYTTEQYKAWVPRDIEACGYKKAEDEDEYEYEEEE